VIEVIRDSNIMQVFEIDNTRTQRQLLAVFGGYTHDLIENVIRNSHSQIVTHTK